jgi:hypothetical protein
MLYKKQGARMKKNRPSVALSHTSRPASFDSIQGGHDHQTRSILNEDETIRKAVASDVAMSINETMKTIGLLAALLSS